ncbi:hypothetical protein [Sediminivirga luteola]|uniref:Uncharacterized protein n=1 Tax=Sediminivirga luteola TaxID=1774748 RepID=A0A8J2U0T2_9MICO|nr:hypothetical protein [Sediminivirga luteola]MCI2264927.1 hypothetical protein [Sediminivirga luteola]GGA26180.1 hypothetical protein GCM10011333_31360 [Sediminivirga luteola]
MLGLLAAAAPGLLAAGCGVRLEDFGPEPVPRPDASERARDSIAVVLDRWRGVAAALAVQDGPERDAAAALAEAAALLLRSLGGVYANTSSTVTPTPTPYQPAETAREPLLSALEDTFGEAGTVISDELAELDAGLRPLAAQAACGLGVAARWWAEATGRDRRDQSVLDAFAAAAQEETARQETATPPPSTAPVPSAAPAGLTAELLQQCYAADYLVELAAARGSDEEQETARRLLSDLSAWKETLRGRLRAEGLEVPQPAAAYQPPEGAGDDTAAWLQEVIGVLAARIAAVLQSGPGLLHAPAVWLQALGQRRFELDGELDVTILQGEETG